MMMNQDDQNKIKNDNEKNQNNWFTQKKVIFFSLLQVSHQMQTFTFQVLVSRY